MLVVLQRRNERAAHLASISLALGYYGSQDFLDAAELSNALLDGCQFSPSQFTGFPAMTAILQREQVADFIETEPELLCLSNEADPLRMHGCVSAYATHWLLRRLQQAPLLIKPDCFDVDTSRAGQRPNREVRSHVDPVP